MTEPYSVLMTVYYACDAAQFDTALQSMERQTVPPDDIVIFCDGTPSEELRQVISIHQTHCGPRLQVLQSDVPLGIGGATQKGLAACKYDLVAKMDADDIALPYRCEHQLQRFRELPTLAVLGGEIEEFQSDPSKVDTVRKVPYSDAEIRRFAKRRQPFNNMTVMYRKSAVLSVGGYRPLRRNEDYDLYVRLLHHGYAAENLPEILVKARVDSDAYARRGSLQTFAGTVRSRFYALRIGFSSPFDFIFCFLGAFLMLILPTALRKQIYRKFLRSRNEKPKHP